MWTWQTKLIQIRAFSVGITILNERIIWKDDIEFVTEFPYLLGHPVLYRFFEHLFLKLNWIDNLVMIFFNHSTIPKIFLFKLLYLKNVDMWILATNLGQIGLAVLTCFGYNKQTSKLSIRMHEVCTEIHSVEAYSVGGVWGLSHHGQIPEYAPQTIIDNPWRQGKGTQYFSWYRVIHWGLDFDCNYIYKLNISLTPFV